jgi:ABC-type nitrate/sulfonate/bicarbonate transport system permease component
MYWLGTKVFRESSPKMRLSQPYGPRLKTDRLLSFVSVALILAAWAAASAAQLAPPVFLAPPEKVFWTLLQLAGTGELAADLGTSLFRAFAGLALATVVGCALGISIARVRWVAWAATPFVALGFPAPKIAFLPIFILWFGLDHLSKILLVSFATIFPLIIASADAARAVSRVLIWSARSLGSSDHTVMRRVILPACLPSILAGMRVALPVALITTFTAEMVAGGGGMGASLMYAQRFFETPTVFAYLVVMLVLGLALDAVLKGLQRILVPWHAAL